MAEEAARKQQYQYASNANLVLTAERDKSSRSPRRGPELLRGCAVWRLRVRDRAAHAGQLEQRLANNFQCTRGRVHYQILVQILQD